MGGWALTSPILKSSLRKNDVTRHVMTSSNIYPRKVRVCYDVSATFLYFSLGRPKKGEYRGLTNAEKCKLYRAKNNSDKKKKYEALRKKIWRAKLKENPHQYEQYKVNERYRKLKKTSNATTSDNSDIVMESQSMEEKPGSSTGQNDTSPSISPSSFSNKQSLHRSLSRANNFLPKSPHKRAEVIEKLANKYKVKFNFKKSTRGRPRKDLNEEEKRWLIEFLARADLTYTNPGRKDNVYIGKENCERIYKQILYLLWNLRDIIDIANGTGKIEIANSFIQNFNKSLTFLQL